MQIVSNGDNLHEISCPAFRGKQENIINFLSAELIQKVLKVKVTDYIWKICRSFEKGDLFCGRNLLPPPTSIWAFQKRELVKGKSLLHLGEFSLCQS